jgi:hypothetical protein
LSRVTDAFEQMKAVCEHIGVTPLTQEEFIKEDQRIYMDLVRRRNGLDPHMQREPFNFGVYR